MLGWERRIEAQDAAISEGAQRNALLLQSMNEKVALISTHRVQLAAIGRTWRELRREAPQRSPTESLRRQRMLEKRLEAKVNQIAQQRQEISARLKWDQPSPPILKQPDLLLQRHQTILNQMLGVVSGRRSER